MRYKRYSKSNEEVGNELVEKLDRREERERVRIKKISFRIHTSIAQ
jgi:hypothetical protein